MKEELQGKLVEILTSLQATVGKATDFASAQLPDIAQSYIAYGRASASLCEAFGVLLVIAGIAMVVIGIRKKIAGDAACAAARAEAEANRERHVSRYDFPDGDGVYMPGGVASVMGAFLLALASPNFLMVWLAPKVWLIKEIAGMLR